MRAVIDIYLYDVANASAGAVHLWSGVPVGDAALVTQIYPSWYNAASAGSTALAFQFIDAGQPLWSSSYPVGPTFQAVWDGTDPQSVDSPTTSWNTTVSHVRPVLAAMGITGGKLAAAVLFPILACVHC